MNYSKNAYDKAFAIIQERREKAEFEQQRRLEEISKLAPEIIVLQNKLLSTRFELIQLVMKEEKNIMSIVDDIKKKNLETQQAIEELLLALKGDKHYLDVHYYCEICKDTGSVEGRRCECLTKLLDKYLTEEINKNCLIKLNDFDDFSLDYYDKIPNGKISTYDGMKMIYEYCRNYVDNFSTDSPSLFFIGQTGLGKTFLSSCIAKALIEKNVNVVFGSVIDFIRKVENEHFRQESGNTLEILVNADIVILDDLGSEFMNTFTESVIYEIINSRINQQKPTIISTNLTLPQLGNKYNDRIVSRLTGCFKPIGFFGSDIRQKKRLENLE